MRLNLLRNRIEVIPETDQDIAYIEDTLGLKKQDDGLLLVRQNPKIRYNFKPEQPFVLAAQGETEYAREQESI